MDIFKKAKRSEIMSRVRGKDSGMELKFRKALWKNGFRYLKNSTKYYGKPDLVLPKYKAVVFLDSCFWHRCEMHYQSPKTRPKFWDEKILKNKKRDEDVTRYYMKKGWTPIRIWEHDLKTATNFNAVIDCAVAELKLSQ